MARLAAQPAGSALAAEGGAPLPEEGAGRSAPKTAPKGSLANLWLGQKLRGLRQMRELSIEQVARLAGLSVGAVSQIERGLSAPSVRSLHRLADALSFRVADLIAEPNPPPLNELGRIVRADTRRVLRLSENGVTKELLSPSTPGGLEQLLVTLEPGASSGAEPYTHRGEECGHVLQGRLALTIDGDTHVLAPGDSFRFKSTIPHRFANADDGVTRVIWTIWTRPGA
jgi:transcriptional regulator with XRE-family HTH domain